LGSREDGADAVQEALVAAWKGLPALREPLAFGAWFHRLVVRSAMRAARKRSRHRIAPLAINELAPEPSVRDHALDSAFDELSPPDRALISLRYVLGYGITETAVILGVPEGTVKSRGHAAVRRLRAAYEGGRSDAEAV
jgi:RNA polymerase sigma-70 factor (ECF subfamily)